MTSGDLCLSRSVVLRITMIMIRSAIRCLRIERFCRQGPGCWSWGFRPCMFTRRQSPVKMFRRSGSPVDRHSSPSRWTSFGAVAIPNMVSTRVRMADASAAVALRCSRARAWSRHNESQAAGTPRRRWTSQSRVCPSSAYLSGLTISLSCESPVMTTCTE